MGVEGDLSVYLSNIKITAKPRGRLEQRIFRHLDLFLVLLAQSALEFDLFSLKTILQFLLCLGEKYIFLFLILERPPYHESLVWIELLNS